MGHAAELELGIMLPTPCYPLFENALRHEAGRTAAEQSALHRRAVGRLQPGRRREPLRRGPHRLLSPTRSRRSPPSNRIIGFPYTKHMVSNPDLDVASARSSCARSSEADGAGDRPRPLGVPLVGHRRGGSLHVRTAVVHAVLRHPHRRRRRARAGRRRRSTTSRTSTCTRASPPRSRWRDRRAGRRASTGSSPCTAGCASPADRGTTRSATPSPPWSACCATTPAASGSSPPTAATSRSTRSACTRASPARRTGSATPTRSSPSTTPRRDARSWSATRARSRSRRGPSCTSATGRSARAHAAVLTPDGRRAWGVTDDHDVMAAMEVDDFAGRAADPIDRRHARRSDRLRADRRGSATAGVAAARAACA